MSDIDETFDGGETPATVTPIGGGGVTPEDYAVTTDDGDGGVIGTWEDESEFEAFEDLDPTADYIPGEDAETLPVVAIVGRPNVGKSTLVNRIIGRREAVTEDIPGVTRDKVAYQALWNGRRFMVLDTGGWEPDAKGIGAAITRQAESALEVADAVVFVMDATVGETTTDELFANKLRRANIPLFLAANKADSEKMNADVAYLWSMGLGEPYGISAAHGRGTADLLDAVLAKLPAKPRVGIRTEGGPRRVAFVGRPNVGKSSLLNKLSGEELSVVDNVAGTTVDPVDSLVVLDGETWQIVDTAGLRKRVIHASGHEYYASLRTKSAIDAAEVVVLLIDASTPITEQDQRVLSMVIDAGRAVVIAFNKWDLVDEDRRWYLDKEIDRELARIPWATRVNVSALTGRSVHKLVPHMREALDSWDRRIATGRLNAWLKAVIAETPPPVRGGKQPRVLFATQAATRPPTFVLFTTGFLEAGYRRFLERRLREEFGFHGSPVRINVRVREKRQRK